MDCKVLFRLPVSLFFVLLLAGVMPVHGAESQSPEESGPMLNEAEFEGLGAEVAAAVGVPAPATVFSGNAYLGQSFISNNEAGVRAFPYTYLRPGFVGGGTLTLLDKNYTLDLEGNYLSDRDNHGRLAVDFSGHYRFLFLTDVFFHNLHAERFSWSSPLTLSNGNTVSYDPQPSPATHYGVTIRQDKAFLRAKPTDYPFHVDLGFRRYSRQGESQLRLADFRFASPTNVVYNRQRAIDQVIYEGNAGVDAHLGYVDFVNQFQILQFVDNQSIPRMINFQPQQNATTTFRSGGFLQHNENPDSRFWANTVRLHTSISSGLVGALSYTYGQRQSFSKLADIVGAADVRTVVRNMAGDVTYTPRPEFTVSVKYRRQVTDHEIPAAVVRLPSGGAPAGAELLPTQSPVDYRLNSLISTLMYRPLSWLLVKGEFKGDFVRRKADYASTLTPWISEHHEDRYQGKAALIMTPAKGIRIKGQYTYNTISNPLSLYATTYDERHTGELIATLNRSNAFGTSLSYKEVRDVSDRFDAKQRVITTAGWLNLLSQLTLNASFAYLRNDSDRTIIYRNDTTPIFQAPANFGAMSHIYNLNAILHVLDRADFTVGYQQVRSKSSFTPLSPTSFSGTTSVPVTATTDGITDISRTNDVEHEVTTRIDYRLTESIQSTVEYIYRVVHNYVDTSLNGGAHQIVATLGFKW